MEQGFARDKLEVEIRKSFPGFQMDLKFQAGGGITGILGPSGCGKSMTLISVAGIVMPAGFPIFRSAVGRKPAGRWLRR